MDIYQIWTQHNKNWTQYEILVFGVVLLVTIGVIVCCILRNKICISQAIAIFVMILFLGIVFGSTVFTRESDARQYELQLFWSWRNIIRDGDMMLLKENVLNCLLLLPAGVLLPFILNHKVKWYYSLLFGIGISVVIEVCQLIFMRGLFEWDDMIHNGLGCMLGGQLVNNFKKNENGC